MGAIREVTDEIDILHLWPSDQRDMAAVDREQSERFGLAVTSHVIQQKAEPHTSLNNYFLGSFSACRQTQYFPHCGAEQVERVKRLLAWSPEFVFVHRLAGMLPVIRFGLPSKARVF